MNLVATFECSMRLYLLSRHHFLGAQGPKVLYSINNGVFDVTCIAKIGVSLKIAETVRYNAIKLLRKFGRLFSFAVE